MKKLIFTITTLLFCGLLTAQLAAWRDGNLVFLSDMNAIDSLTFNDLNVKLHLETQDLLEGKNIAVGKQFNIIATIDPAPIQGGCTIVWNSSNENVATVENGVVSAISIGEAIITASIYGTNINASVVINVVNPWDYLDFNNCIINYTVNTNNEYPFIAQKIDAETGDTILITDINGDGNDDVTYPIYIYIPLNKELEPIIDPYWGFQNYNGMGYFLIINSSIVYDGKYIYLLSDYEFSNDESKYMQTHEGKKYIKPNYATYSYFNADNYCKIYEGVLYGEGDWDQLIAKYGGYTNGNSSYIYYSFSNGGSFAGLITNGTGFSINVNDNGEPILTYLDLELTFFSNLHAGGVVTEINEEGTEMFKMPLQMAPYNVRNISFDNREKEPAASKEKSQPRMIRIPEKQMKVNKLLNIPLLQKLNK